VAARVA